MLKNEFSEIQNSRKNWQKYKGLICPIKNAFLRILLDNSTKFISLQILQPHSFKPKKQVFSFMLNSRSISFLPLYFHQTAGKKSRQSMNLNRNTLWHKHSKPSRKLHKYSFGFGHFFSMFSYKTKQVNQICTLESAFFEGLINM